MNAEIQNPVIFTRKETLLALGLYTGNLLFKAFMALIQSLMSKNYVAHQRD